MKQLLLLLFKRLFIVNCNSPQTPKYTKEPIKVETLIGEEGETTFLRYTSHANLNTEEFIAWFQLEYDMFKISREWLEEHTSLSKNIEFKLFLETFCGDTQRELGKTFKLLDLLGVTEDRLEIYAISEEKDSRLGYEKEYDILNIPTLIFLENGKENNRIIKFSVKSIIENFSKILKKKFYKDAHANF